MRQITKCLVPTVAASLVLAACGSGSSTNSNNSSASSTPAASQSGGSASASAVKTEANATIGATVLVNAQGITLYHLSGEQNGKWICTSAGCVQAWHPLSAPTGGSPTGSVGSLGTVKRPDGTMQVTYKGMPLYTFAQDQQPGDAKGQGIKDVGTWTAVTAGGVASSPSTTSTPAPAPAPATSSGGGGYGY